MQRTRVDLLIITLTLASFGVVMVYSSSAIYAYQRFGDSLYFLKRALIYLLIGTALMFYLMNSDYRRLANYSRVILVISVALLILVFLPILEEKWEEQGAGSVYGGSVSSLQNL